MAEEQAQSIGAARVDIVINLDDYKAEIDRAKNLAAGLGKDFEASFQKMTGSSKRATAEALRLSQTWGKNADEIKLLALAARGAAPEALEALRQRMAAARLETGKSGAGFNAYGKSAKEMTFALRQVPAQLTDITVGLASGQRPLTVLLQQGGQLKDLFGGIKPAAQALGSALLRLINPYTLLALAAGVTIKAFLDGRKEGQEFAKAIALSGNAAGVTSDQLQTMADNVDKVIGTQHQASAVLAELVRSGKVANEQLQSGAIAAIRLEKSAGISASETIKNLVALGERPVEASKKLNDQYRYLKASIYGQIAALEDQGRHAEAAALAQSEYQKAIQKVAGETEKQLGLLQAIGRDTGDVFNKMWDAFLGIGRPETIQDQIDRAQGQLDQARRSLANPGVFDNINGANDRRRENILSLESKLNSLKEAQRLTALFAQQDKDAADANAKAIADQDVERKQAEKNRDALRKYFSDRRRAQLSIDLAAIKSAASAEVDVVNRQQDLLEARHAAGLVSERDYYAQRRQLIEQTTAIQAASLRQENTRLQLESSRVQEEAEKAKAFADRLKGTGSDQYAKALEDASQKQDEARRLRLQNDAQVKANSVELTKLTKDQVSQTELLTVQESARAAALVRSYEQAKAAADNYLDTLARQYRLEESDQFAGNRQRERDSGRSSIEEKYAQQRQQVEVDRSNNPTVDPAIYDQRLALIEDGLQKELALYEEHWQKLRDGETKWRNGATEAINNYVDNARDIASQTGNLVSNALQQGEDAWVHFVQTGKLSVTSLVDGIIADFARLKFKQLLGGLFSGAGTAGGVGGFFSSLFGGFREAGGDAEPGKAYIVGEKRPEIFVPRTAGRIIPSLAAAAAGGGSIVNHNSFAITVQAPDGRISRATESQLSVALVRAVQRGARNVR